jgi:four helix bundle protein
MRPHQKLDLWKRSVDFVVAIYRLTEQFPKEEKFGLTSQLRRAAVSVAANVAEGAAKTSTKDFRRYLSNSQGSTSEIETELLIALRLNYLDEADFQLLSKDLDDVGRMITGLSRSLQRQES